MVEEMAAFAGGTSVVGSDSMSWIGANTLSFVAMVDEFLPLTATEILEEGICPALCLANGSGSDKSGSDKSGSDKKGRALGSGSEKSGSEKSEKEGKAPKVKALKEKAPKQERCKSPGKAPKERLEKTVKNGSGKKQKVKFNLENGETSLFNAVDAADLQMPRASYSILDSVSSQAPS